jgi:hypothetical protein
MAPKKAVKQPPARVFAESDSESDKASAGDASDSNESNESDSPSSGYGTPRERDSDVINAMLAPELDAFVAEPPVENTRSSQRNASSSPKKETIYERRSMRHVENSKEAAGSSTRAARGKQAAAPADDSSSESASSSEDLDTLPSKGYAVHNYAEDSGLRRRAPARSMPEVYEGDSSSDFEDAYGRSSRPKPKSLPQKLLRSLIPLALLISVGLYLFPPTNSTFFPLSPNFRIRLAVLCTTSLIASLLLILIQHFALSHENAPDPTPLLVTLFVVAAVSGVLARGIPAAFNTFEMFVRHADPFAPVSSSPHMKGMNEMYPSNPSKAFGSTEDPHASFARTAALVVLVPAVLIGLAMGMVIVAGIVGLFWSWDLSGALRGWVVGETEEVVVPAVVGASGVAKRR